MAENWEVSEMVGHLASDIICIVYTCDKIIRVMSATRETYSSERANVNNLISMPIRDIKADFDFFSDIEIFIFHFD